MMSSANQDRLQRAYAAFNSGSTPDWTLFDPAIQHDQTEGLFLDGVFYGHDGLRAALGEIEADWEGLNFEPEEYFEVGERLLVLIRMRARVRGSNAQLDAQIGHLWEFRDGRVVRWTVYGDRAAALRAVRATGSYGTPIGRA
jgi:ketosteroid isomerase-like protein